jgi:signal transduction histidine kinase
MSAIIGYSRLILRETEGQISQLQRENLQDLLRNAEHLLGQINSLLDLAKIEAGRLEVRTEPVQINTLIDEFLAMVTPMMRHDRVRLIRDMAPDIPTLNTDPDKLRQIILNLLSNAVKFTDEGEIKVSTRRQNESLRVTVSDTGIGIREEELQHIFEEFRQVDMSNGRKYAGTGLGLTIAKKFANLLGGDITVESEAGKGSTFTVTLPLGPRESETD